MDPLPQLLQKVDRSLPTAAAIEEVEGAKEELLFQDALRLLCRLAACLREEGIFVGHIEEVFKKKKKAAILYCLVFLLSMAVLYCLSSFM